MSTTTATTTATRSADGPVAAERISYDDLYARWEHGNWRATELDFATDRVQWRERFDDFERRAALWNYALFFHGEDAVALDLAPYIDAAPRPEQKYFLATQQADEARHAVFFGRFMHEVAGVGDSLTSSLDATRPGLNESYVRTFARLDRMADELRRDRSRPKLAAAVALYHVVIEAGLAQPGQHFIERYLIERDVLPAFRAGMRNVALDEQRHIGFGVKLLSDLAREDPDCRYAVADLLREVLPDTIGLFDPPGGDERYIECFGARREDVEVEATISLETKLRSAGLAIDTLPGRPIMPLDLTPVERARRGNALHRAGYLGVKIGPAARDPDSMALLFDTLRRTIVGSGEDGLDTPLTVQWRFADAPPWHLRVAGGTATVAEGAVAGADVRVSCRFEDWVDLFAGRLDPRRALATGRLRPRGRPRALARAAKLLGS